MSTTFRAVYTDGVLHPAQPLALADGQTVDVTVAPIPAPLTEDEIVRCIAACQSYKDLLEATKLLPSDDGGYDVIRSLDENRRRSGESPLLPNESSPT